MSDIDKDFETVTDTLQRQYAVHFWPEVYAALARIEFEYDKRALEVDELRIEVALQAEGLAECHDREAKLREELEQIRDSQPSEDKSASEDWRYLRWIARRALTTSPKEEK